MPRIAIYPGTFDPITKGHVDIVERAAQLFDEVIVAVAQSARKTPLFSLEKRLEMLTEVFKGCANIGVSTLTGRTVDFAAQHQAQYIVRGLRCAADFDYEVQLAGMNSVMSSKIETIFLPSRAEFAAVSSSIVREVIDVGGDASLFVPPAVIKYL